MNVSLVFADDPLVPQSSELHVFILGITDTHLPNSDEIPSKFSTICNNDQLPHDQKTTSTNLLHILHVTHGKQSA